MSTYRNRLPIVGEYPPDWPEIGDRVRAERDHRCIRCGHQFKTGEHGNGEWTPCDYLCKHNGPLAVLWQFAHNTEKTLKPIDDDEAEGLRKKGFQIFAAWRILTVHHLDGNKANCEWWNLLALCQRCHLTIQSRVQPENPYFLEHSEWFRLYAAGFYAKKYEGKLITREEAVRRMDELLAYERLA